MQRTGRLGGGKRREVRADLPKRKGADEHGHEGLHNWARVRAGGERRRRCAPSDARGGEELGSSHPPLEPVKQPERVGS